jgi:uncharacterized membrane protein
MENIMTNQLTEKHSRTLAKTISWRILLTISHFVNALIVTGSIAMGLKIAGWSAVLNSGLYWMHERVWNWIQWNRKPTDNLFFQDGHPRTTTKMITWRVVVNFSNFFIPYFVTGSWGQAGAFFTIAVVVNMALFYLHERGWNFIKWGKIVNTPTDAPNDQ